MSKYQSEYDLLMKILIIGDSGVGKSCMLMRYCDNEYIDSYISTIGVDFKIKTVEYDDKTIKLQIWDTAGQERFRTITSAYYRNCHCIILVYDVGDRMSFNDLNLWMKECDKFASPDVLKIIIGNKNDISDEKRQVSYEEGKLYAESKGMKFLETSAKTASNIDKAFVVVIDEIRKQHNDMSLKKKNENKLSIKIPTDKKNRCTC